MTEQNTSLINVRLQRIYHRILNQLPPAVVIQCRQLALSIRVQLPSLLSTGNWEKQLLNKVESSIRLQGSNFANMPINDTVMFTLLLIQEMGVANEQKQRLNALLIHLLDSEVSTTAQNTSPLNTQLRGIYTRLLSQLPPGVILQCRQLALSIHVQLPILLSTADWEKQLLNKVESAIKSQGLNLTAIPLADTVMFTLLVMQEMQGGSEQKQRLSTLLAHLMEQANSW